MIEFINAISVPFVLFIFVIIGGIVAIIGILKALNASRRKDEIKHQEFEDTAESNHRERMATIAATRDQEIAKHTNKLPQVTKQIDN